MPIRPLASFPLLRPLRRTLPKPPSNITRGLAHFIWITTALITLQETTYSCSFITGTSMQPTLSPDYHTTGREDWVLTRTYRPTSDLHRGDIVCIMSPSKPESDSIKRVVALEGDFVILDPKRRPKALHNGDDSADARGWDAWKGRVKVPHGHVWLEGDNWRDSRDSNHYGPVSKSLVVGRAVRVVTPGEGFWTGVGRGDGFRGRTRVREGACAGCEKIRQGGEAADAVV
ncbi:hypothetical protein MBLNU230_g5197t1 [Neophaeotheca triangularis]